MARVNNKLEVRGRFTRDPRVVDAKDDSGRKFVFGRIAVDSPYEDNSGDMKTMTDYIEIKCFDDTLAQVLIGGEARQGTLIEATGAVRMDRSEYEKDGETRVAHNIACILDNADAHNVVIEAQPRGDE